MNNLAIIPARIGSKALPRKNIRETGGKPLIAWTIEAALRSSGLSRCIVSTDSVEIKSIAEAYGAEVPFLRPAHLATDEATSIDVVLHALEFCASKGEQYDNVMLLQPTSPLRNEFHIAEALQLFYSKNANACVSICETEHTPYWTFFLSDAGLLTPILADIPLRRQEAPATFRLNGAVYIANAKWFMQNKTFLCEDTVPYIMDKEHSIDIDDAMDWSFANLLLEQRGKNNFVARL